MKKRQNRALQSLQSRIKYRQSVKRQLWRRLPVVYGPCWRSRLHQTIKKTGALEMKINWHFIGAIFAILASDAIVIMIAKELLR